MLIERWRRGLPYKRTKKVVNAQTSVSLKECKDITWLSVELRLSTPGRLTEVSQPKPLQNSRMEWANLPGDSSMTLPTLSTLSNDDFVWKKECFAVNSNIGFVLPVGIKMEETYKLYATFFLWREHPTDVSQKAIVVPDFLKARYPMK